MKPFNLADALAGKPVVTRDGRKVTGIHHFKECKYSDKTVYAVVGNSGEDIRSYDIYGKANCSGETCIDLFMASEEKEVWVNLYYNQTIGMISSKVYTEESTANEDVLLLTKLKTIKTTIEI